MNTLSLKLPDYLLEKLEKQSRARKMTKSSLIRECLEKGLAAQTSGNKTNCFDLAADLAGTIKGMPKDLATNPKYMNNFGS